MDTLIELMVAIVCGGLGVVLFRFLKPESASKANASVVVKVGEKEKENEELLKQIQANLDAVKKRDEEFEKDKKKDVSKEEMEKFFNNRKDIQ